MDCLSFQATLSPYYDGQVTANARETFESHLGSCDGCSVALQEFRRLSQLASLMSQPDPPAEIWQRIRHGLDRTTDAPSLETSKRSRHATAMGLALAALIVISLGVGFFLSQRESEEMHHDHLAVFWKTFESDPAKAQVKLVRQFGGRVVTDEEARGQVGYSPLKEHQLPEGLFVRARYVLEMPCCRCVQTICQRRDGTVLAVFEHNRPQPHWFQDQPKIRIHSAGVLCQVTELKNSLAASWDFEQRTITIVGLRTAEEIDDWGQKFATVFPKPTRTSPHPKLTFEDLPERARSSPRANDDTLRLFDISTVQARGEWRSLT